MMNENSIYDADADFYYYHYYYYSYPLIVLNSFFIMLLYFL